MEKMSPAGLHHTEDRAGDAPKPIQNGNAQIYFKLISNLYQLDLTLAWACMGPSPENHTFTWGDMTLGPARVPKIVPMQGKGV